MGKMVLAVFLALLTSLGCSFAASTTNAAGKPDRLLLQWTSQQQMDWVVRINAQGFRILKAPLAAVDTGRDQGKLVVSVAPDGGSLKIESVTGWSTGSAIVEIEPSKAGSVGVDIQDRYVPDRHTKGQFSLADLKQGRVILVSSKEWPLRNCTFRFTMAPAEVEQETQLLKTLGDNRKKNIDALLAGAVKSKDKARRTDLLLRAAAACTGGCNHGPLEPNGWDLAIATYQKVIDENKGTDVGLNAMWAQASCYACWSPYPFGCDRYGRGKGDEKAAIKLYEKLYQLSSTPSDKADALRRMAEVQCFEADCWSDGLRNYKKLAVELPDSLPPSSHWTYRTCAPPCGKEKLAWDIYRAMVFNTSDSRNVQPMFDEHFMDMKNNPVVDELALLVQGINTRKGSGQVEPKIITKREMILVGLTSDCSDIHGLWMKYAEKDKAIKHKVEGTGYELHRGGLDECTVATEVTRIDAIPEEMSVLRIPAGQYAIFTHRLANGGYKGIDPILEKWLATAPYEHADNLYIQAYDKRFKGGDQPDSEIDFIIRVKPRK